MAASQDIVQESTGVFSRQEALLKTATSASATSICTMYPPDEAASEFSSKASGTFTDDSDCEEDVSPALPSTISADGHEAVARMGGVALTNFEVLRRLAEAEEAKARFESRLELDDEDDESDSEDEFVRGLGRCARQWAMGGQPRHCADA